jgi:hypothetical protein
MYRNFKCLSPIPTSVKIRAIRSVVLAAETYEDKLPSHCAFILCVSNKYPVIIQNMTAEDIFCKGKEVQSNFTSQETRTIIMIYT